MLIQFTTMKLAFLLLVCSVSVTLQQDSFWSFPYSWLPHYFTGYPPSPIHQQDPYKINQPIAFHQSRHGQQDTADLLRVIIFLKGSKFYFKLKIDTKSWWTIFWKLQLVAELKGSNRKKVQIVPESADAEGRIKIASFDKNKPENRGFGGLKWLGLNALINNGYTAPASTSTAYTTAYSTITVGTVVSCYTRTMFTSTTPCRRRKRKMLPGLLVGDDNIDSPISPSKTES